jgi:hypothetical protein
MEVSVQLVPGRFIPEERVSIIHWIGDYVGPRACPEALTKRKYLTLLGIELRSSGPLPNRYTDRAN